MSLPRWLLVLAAVSVGGVGLAVGGAGWLVATGRLQWRLECDRDRLRLVSPALLSDWTGALHTPTHDRCMTTRLVAVRQAQLELAGPDWVARHEITQEPFRSDFAPVEARFVRELRVVAPDATLRLDKDDGLSVLTLVQGEELRGVVVMAHTTGRWAGLSYAGPAMSEALVTRLVRVAQSDVAPLSELP